MSRLNFSSREKMITVMLAGVVAAYAFVQGLYLPFQRKNETMAQKITVAQGKLRKNLGVIEQSKGIEQKYQYVLDTFRQKGSQEQVMSSILSEIEGVAGEVNMRIADMKPKRVRPVDLYNNFSVSLAVDAPLTEILRFVYLLQTPPHMFQIEELSLNNNAGRPDVPLRCQLVLSRTLIPPQ